MTDETDPMVVKEAYHMLAGHDADGPVATASLKATLMEVMANTGEDLPEDEIDSLIEDASEDGGKTVTLDGFSRVIFEE